MKKLFSLFAILMVTITAWAIEPVQPAVGDGSSANPYLIGSPGNLVWFAQQVNGGAITINGKLTADIDLGNDQTMIGTDKCIYWGTFDGDGHTVTVNYIAKEDNTGLFRYILDTTIKNLKTAGSITTGFKSAGGIVGKCYNTNHITNCASSVTIKSTFTSTQEALHGGIVGYCDLSVFLTNVIFNGKLLGEHATSCGGLVGYAYEATFQINAQATNCLFCPSELTVNSEGFETLIRGYQTTTNCYYTTTIGSVQGTQISAEAVASGEACYRLNGGDTGKNDGTQAWYQNLDNGEDKDATPVPFNTHGAVYGGDNQCPLNTYSNTQRFHSGFDAEGTGTCPNLNCGYTGIYQPATLVNGVYEIANKGNLIWFANKVNSGATNIKGRLTADIDLGDDQTMIGTSNNPYKSTFDGNGHTVNVRYYDSEFNTALFRYVNGATICNLKTSGSITSGHACAAGIVANSRETTNIINCASSVAITTINSVYITSSGCTHGGIVANNTGTVNLTNVIFNGQLLGSVAWKCGGLIGWSQTGCKIVNSLFCPSEMTFSKLESATWSNGNGITVENCYYTVSLRDNETLGTATTSDDVASGKVCYALNEGKTDGTQAWCQNIDNGEPKDATPVPFNTHGTVYGGEDQCPLNTYSNTQRYHNIPNGYGTCQNTGCTCSDFCQPATLVDGVYEIANKGNLIWFANKVNSGATKIKGKLTADIDLGNNQTMIGTNEHKYNSIFDGDGHTVTVNYTATADNTALFRYVSWSTIKNLNTAGNISTGNKYAAGIVAECHGDTYIQNCASSITITSASTTVKEGIHGGIVANNRSKVYLTNVLFHGGFDCEFANNCGGLVGWSETSATITNCLFKPVLLPFNKSGAKTLARGNGISVTNSYYLHKYGDAQGTMITSRDIIASGEICYKLNNSKADGTQAWYQNLDNGQSKDDTPVPFNTHGTVYGDETLCPAGSYSNIHQEHFSNEYDEDGISHCTNTGCTSIAYQPPMEDVLETYIIRNKGNLIWFAQQVNAGQNSINGRLTADIDLGDDQTMIGTSDYSYKGTFDGDGHTITVNYTATEDVTALFRYVGTATIKNLITSGTINTSHKQAAGVAGKAGNLTLDCVMSNVTINSTHSGDSSHGGLVADISSTSAITNCAFTGKLLGASTEKCGGFVGWEENARVSIKNSYLSIAEQTVSTTNCTTFARYRYGGPTITNCYYVTPLGYVHGTATTAEAVASGELCYKLNSGKTDGTQAWYQNIDNSNVKDNMPVFDNTHGTVYGGEDKCPKDSYSNESHSHNFGNYEVDGTSHCSNSGCTAITYQPATQDALGSYLIANKGNLIWFAQQVNAGQYNINGKLTANINLGNDQTMIGTETNMYAGTFDGDGHSIIVNYTATDHVTAIFRYVMNGTIKNLMTEGTINTAYRDAAGVAGQCYGITLDKVVSQIAINSTYVGDATHGGLVNVCHNLYSSLTDCAFIGQLNGASTTNCAGLVGHIDNCALSLKNCYVYPSADFTVSATGSKTLVRHGNPTIDNCYYVKALGDAQGKLIEEPAISAGAFVYDLGSNIWVQDTDLKKPLPFGILRQLGKYLKLTAQADGNITIKQTGTVTATLQSTDNGITWADVTYDTPISLTAGQSIYLRAKGVNGKNAKLNEDDENYLTFTSTMDVAASNNIMSLLDATSELKEVPQYAFYKLFYNWSHLTHAPELPATMLNSYCYLSMFEKCTSLTTIPDLSQARLPYDCTKACRWMFDGCSNLKINKLGLGSEWKIQAEDSKTGANSNFFQMFWNTGGSFDGTPQKDVTYYIYDDEPYTRQMSNEWGTVVLPFDVAYDADNTNYELYHLTAANSKNLYFTEFESGTIAAGTPMAVKAIGDKDDDGKYNISIPSAKGKFSGTINEQNSTNAQLPTDWTMTGSYSNVNDKTGIYFIAQNQFWYADDPITIAPFRAWFTGPTSTSNTAKSLNIIIDEETTGINEIVDGSLSNCKWYNLNGQRVNANTKGIIIKNGRKILNK